MAQRARPEPPWAARARRAAARLGLEAALRPRARPRKAEKKWNAPFSTPFRRTETPLCPAGAAVKLVLRHVQRIALAKAEFFMYTAWRHPGLSSRRLTWRRRGARPLRQAHDTLRRGDEGVADAPAERKPRLLDQLRQLGVNRSRVRGRLIRHPKPGLGC